MPIGDLLIDEVFDGERPDIPSESDSDEFEDVQMTVVERSGRWYLSAFYTAAEFARGDDQEIPATGVQPAGADEPELAIDQMLEAISDQDVEAAIAVLDPTEAEALQRYSPLFLDEAQQLIDEADLEWSIDQREYTVEGSGDRRTVDIDAFRFTVTEPGGDGEVIMTLADDCLTVSFNGDETTSCGIGQGGFGDLADEMGLDENGEVTDLLDTLEAAFDDYDPSGIGVHQVDGSWYVSPLSTAFDAFNDVLDALDRDELTDVIDAFEQLGQMDYIEELPGIVEDETGLDTGLDTGTDTGRPTSTSPRLMTNRSKRSTSATRRQTPRPACSACRTASRQARSTPSRSLRRSASQSAASPRSTGRTCTAWPMPTSSPWSNRRRRASWA